MCNWIETSHQSPRKVLMEGKLIAVAYTLRTYWNQFSLGGSLIFIIHVIISCDLEYFIDFFSANGFHVRLWLSSCILLFRPKTVHCSTKNAYTSFLALVPCHHGIASKKWKPLNSTFFTLFLRTLWKNMEIPQTP